MAQQAYAPPFVRRALAAAPALRRVVWILEAVFLALVWGVLALLPTDRASALGRACARRFGPRLRKHRHVLRNLEIALPERTPAEREVIAREVWGSLGAVFAELPHIGRISREWEQRVDVVIQGKFAPAEDPPRPVIMVTGHLANWELSPLSVRRYDVPLSVIYSPNSTPTVDRLIRRMRRSVGCELVSKRGGMRALLRGLARGRSIGFLLDTRQDDGEWVPFFGVPALTSTVPARLALRSGIDLVPGRIERIGAGANFRVTLGPPIEPDPAVTDVREQARAMTQQVNEILASWIRARPEQWVCTKYRWPKDAVPAGASPQSEASGEPDSRS
jgi:KDO2-lipid IV(A) lauroyltransferase